MKKYLLIFLLLLLIPVSGWTTTYYATVNGTVTAANKANATSCSAAGSSLNLAQVNAATFAGDDVIDGCSETYTSGTLTPHNGGSDGHQITYQNFILTQAGVIDVNIVAKHYITINRCKMSGGVVYINASTNAIVKYSVISNCTNNYGVYVDGASTAFLYNNTITSNYTGGIYSVTPANVTATNNLILGNGTNAGGGMGAFRSTGTLTADYNLVTGNGVYPSWNFTTTGVTDGGHNIKQSLPLTTSPKTNAAYFVLTTDDQGIAYWESLSSALSSYGAKFTMVLQTAGLTAGNITSLTTLVAAGHDIAVHAKNHTDLSQTYPFTVTTTNADPTIDVDLPTKTLTLATTTGGNTVIVDWSVADKTITDLKTAVSGKGWTITNSANTSNNVYLKDLADTVGAQAVGAGYQALYDLTVFWNDEIVGAKDWITANIGMTPTVAGPPSGGSSAGLKTYYKDTAGFLGARTGINFPLFLSSVNIFNIGSLINQYTWFGDGTEATVRAYTRGIYTHAIENGMVTVFTIHNTTDLSLANTVYLVDEIQKAGGTWVLLKNAITAIKADHATADNYTYTKTYTDVSDYTLKSASPASKTGVAIAGIHDQAGCLTIDGVSCYTTTPNMGAYSSSLAGGGGVFGFGRFPWVF